MTVRKLVDGDFTKLRSLTDWCAKNDISKIKNDISSRAGDVLVLATDKEIHAILCVSYRCTVLGHALRPHAVHAYDLYVVDNTTSRKVAAVQLLSGVKEFCCVNGYKSIIVTCDNYDDELVTAIHIAGLHRLIGRFNLLDSDGVVRDTIIMSDED